MVSVFGTVKDVMHYEVWRLVRRALRIPHFSLPFSPGLP